MNKDVGAQLEVFYFDRDFFTDTNDIDPTEIANEEANPAKKLRKWRFAGALEQSMIAVLTRNIRPRIPRLDSAMSLNWHKRRHLSSDHDVVFGCLPVLGAQKYRYPPGWRNQQGW